MRSLLQSVAVCVFIPSIVLAQDDVVQDAPEKPAAAKAQSYVVQVTEYRLKDSGDPRLSAQDLLKGFDAMKSDGTLDLIETVRLSALEGHESMSQFGRSTFLTTGVAATGFGGRTTSRTLQQTTLGTILTVTASPQEGKVLLKLSYEASRHGEAKAEDTPPDMSKVQVNTTLLVEPGTPTLIGGLSTDDATNLLLVLVEKK